MRFWSRLVAGLVAALLGTLAQAGAAERLRAFVRDVRTGQASFTQTVTSADGARRKVSSGQFEFQRPNRFRFDYGKPNEQLIVADGQRVWIYDADLNQAQSRPQAKAIGATPAALLAGGSLEADFTLADEAARDGIEWVRATPKAPDGPLQAIRIGFRGAELAAVEITDAFGQRSLLQFGPFSANAAIAAERFRFVPPAGADVVRE
jgi:outer membrane lipoprotein carrier protein